MANSFSFVATLGISKESEKFKPYDERTYDSGWTNRTLKFNAMSGGNRHQLEIKGGCWADGHGSVKTFAASTIDENGSRVRGERIEIPWADRLKPESVAKVASFKKFVVDLDDSRRRSALRKIISGDITDENFAAAGIQYADQAASALEVSKSKRHEFITEYDFAEFVYKLVSSDSVKGKRFRVEGDIEISEYNGSFYHHLMVTHIYRCSNDTEYKNDATFNIHFGKGAFDDTDADAKGKYYINGYTFNYDSQRRKQIPCPITLVLPVGTDEKSKKYVEVLKKNFIINDIDGNICKELTVKVDCINGAEKLELTEDMLTETESELLLIGAVTLDDILRDRGRQVYGDRIREYVITGFARGWLGGARATAYTADDFELAPIESASASDDLFAEDDDDMDI